MRLWFVISLLAALPSALGAQPSAPATDLDRLMAEVVAKRDDNWKKLQQYILDERQRVTVTGPDGGRIFGAVRDYQWFVKDGFFIRSPLVANGVRVSESDRRRYEARYLERMKAREARKAKREAERGRPTPPAPEPVGDLLGQNAEPAFVSAAYFLDFPFEAGRYAFVGRETFDGREVLRVEYYPARLFNEERSDEKRAARRRDTRPRRNGSEEPDERIERQMNATSLVTLWVLRDEKQIVQYVFDNVDWAFLPGRSLVRLDDVRASMRLHEAFPGVWLPKTIASRVKGGTALGPATATYDVAYTDYRQAGVTVRVK